MPILGIIASSTLVAAGDFESIATATGTGSNTTLTFSSIPGTYQYLQLRLLTRANDGGSNNAVINVRFNSDTGSNYTRHQLKGDGSSASAFGAASQTQAFITSGSAGSNALANAMGVSVVDIHDYANTSKYKTVRSLTGMDLNSVDGQILLTSSVWMDTNAITSISIFHNSGETFTTSTVASLYGIKGA